MNVLHIVSIICFTLCIVMFLYLKWYIKKQTSSSVLLANELDERQTEVARLIAEIDRITDRDSQLVEDRVNKLKELLHDVDKRIALYEKDMEDLSQRGVGAVSINDTKPEALYTSLGRGIRAALTTPQEIAAPPSPPVPAPVPAAPPPVLPASPPAAETERPLPKPPSKKQIRSYIDILVNEGHSPQEIASRLEISVAEVNLAMNLRRGK